MTTRVRTLNFLPEIFQTKTNAEFLAATLDQLVNPPVVQKIQGYIGSKIGYGVNANDYYVTEPNKTRTDYQLEPGVVFTKPDQSVAQDFISYPGILDALELQGGVVDNNSRLFESQIYSWDSFTNLDKIVNFSQYYWIPEGPPAVTIAAALVYSTNEYTVTDLNDGYEITDLETTDYDINPTITLLRGGVYEFNVDQDTQFWIQGEPGVSGFSPTQTNLNVRDVLGVTNNGATQGTVSFTVPSKDAQNQYIFPGNNLVDLVSTIPYATLNGATLTSIGSIDGITSINGLTVMFYNTNEPAASLYFYQISVVSDVISLTPVTLIPNEQKITVSYGTTWINRNFYRSPLGIITLIPYITATLDTLYYQDGTSPNKVGVIKLIESNNTNAINVELDILGKKNYTSSNGVVFTNGLKVEFVGDVIPSSYLSGEYYVEGVGTAIELVSVDSLVSPEEFSSGAFVPYDTTPFDIGNFDSNLFVPIDIDYITIARNAINKNAWSRSNRWFHSQVINQTAVYNNDPDIVTQFANAANKAKRPIIEFYPNLKLFNSGTVGKDAVDFIDTRSTDALSQVAGLYNYYPDVEVYTSNAANIAGVTGTSTTITIPTNDIVGTFQVGQYVSDYMNVLPVNSQITLITISGSDTVLAISWETSQTVNATTDAAIVATDETTNSYGVFDGARIIFADDTDLNVRNKIYVVGISQLTPSSTPVITLTKAIDGDCEQDNQTVILRGYNNEGNSYYFDGDDWKLAQEKVTVNQAPLFDVFDKNGISFSDTSLYEGTSFRGCKLFSYGIGTGTDDPILGFPIRYSAVENVGDISFDVSLNLDTFDYVSGTTPITQKVNTGYVYNYDTRTDYTRELGWQTAVANSQQYQVFQFEYLKDDPTSTFVCDIAAVEETGESWSSVQVYVNNACQCITQYTYTITDNSTTVELLNTSSLTEDTPIEILVFSNQISNQAYYTIPVNLSNNPLNQDLERVNVGDIRMQYRDIYVNAPNIIGQVFGSNNYRDLGNLVPYGTKIIQNSASLVLPGTFLRKTEHSLFDALKFNSREYIKFKNLLVDTINNSEYVQRYTPADILDQAIDIITSSKSEEQAFFWSDMIPAKSPFRSNTYVFANDLDTSIYPLFEIYDFSTANYNGVLVYLTRVVSGTRIQKQLVRNVDYIISQDSPSLTVTLDLIAGDQITVKEYNKTYGSYVPNTPTKLGLYPAFKPEVVLDTGYTQPTYFIKGHDGSYNKLYGSYDTVTNTLEDFRDQGLLEFELRVYNNLKLSNTIPIQAYEVLPGFFRDTDYTYSEFLQMYSETFLDWVGQNRLNYKTQVFSKTNEYTFNYYNSANKLNKQPIEQGYWRGAYQYFYDTTTPNATPWEMLGFTDQPTWWTDRYGPAPYTSDNLVLWNDLEQGIIWNNGTPITVEAVARPGLTQIIPVDSAGDLVSPFVSIVGNYNPNIFQRDWKVGDDAPVELSYRRSSSYPFDLMRIFALMKPANFFNLGVDLDNYKYSEEFNQYLVNNRSHLVISDVEIYGSGTAKTSYINWIVDYEKQLGINATQNITTLLDNLDVRLVYRLAGYSDKDLLKFYVEKGTPNSRNASLLIPDESYSLLLYDNQPFDRIVYSGVVVQITQDGYTVFGNSQTTAYFKTLKPVNNGKFNNIEIENEKVRIAVDYSNTEVLVPYGTKFFSEQEVAQFLASYGAYLRSQGMQFNDIVAGFEVNWNLMISEFLYWSQTGWEVGSIVLLNPAAQNLKINRENAIVQPLTIQNTNFVLNQNLYPIQAKDMSVFRDGTEFSVTALNQGDSVSYGQFNLSNFEHAIVFDNETLFNDTIYNLVTGLRQSRIYVRGNKTAEWNGTINASGFILNQDNITEWSRAVKYTKGSIVLYKNKYWTALKVIEPNAVFNEREWKETDYDQIQKGLLPNSSTRSYESSLYYDVNKANLERDADLLGFSLIGYRPRDYLDLVDLTDITQINVYQNLIKNKGTRNSVEAFKGANLPQGGIEYDVYENWAIKTTEYGGILNKNFVDFRLNEQKLTSNPSIVSLTNGVFTEGSQQEVPIYGLFNYNRPIDTVDILSTIDPNTPSRVFPDAGYVNFNDVKMSSYFYSGLPLAVNKNNEPVPINDFYVRDYAWLANYLGNWDVLTWKQVGRVVAVRINPNNTATVTFAQPHGLSKSDTLAIINYATNIDGYYLVSNVVSLTEVIIPIAVTTVTTTSGQGIGLTFQSQRVDKPSDINSLPLIDAEFVKNTVWVDEGTSGSWEVYRKSLNYQYDNDLSKVSSVTFGSQVAYTDQAGYLVSDAGLGEVYRYTKNSSNAYNIVETLSGGASFGSQIAYAQNTYVISEPTTASEVHVYIINDSQLSNSFVPCQTIAAPGGVTNWGSAIALSGDSNWLYISDIDNNKVHAYTKQNVLLSAGYFSSGETYVITEIGTTDFTLVGAIENKVGITFVATGVGTGTGTATQISYVFAEEIDGATVGAVSNDNFGSSISTNYSGDVVVIGAPNKDYDMNITSWGSAYAFSRSVQNIEIENSNINTLAWTPTTVSKTVSATNSVGNLITLSNTTDISVNDPIMFSGTGLADTGIETNYVYYVRSISGSDITIKTTRSTADIFSITTKGSITGTTANVQTTSLYVYRNGVLVQDSNYGVVGNKLVYSGDYSIGDILTVSGQRFTYVQTFNSQFNNRVGTQFGYSLDIAQSGTEILVGSPFEINENSEEGAVYRYTNAGAKFGLVVGTSDCNVITSRPLLINGYMVNVPVGNAQTVAAVIDTIPNVRAIASNNKLVIQIIDDNLTQVNKRLVITATNTLTLSELGLEVYSETQVINAPHNFGPTQFGLAIKFNEYDSVVISAPVSSRYEGTTFDFVDDEFYQNDTIFDNNATQFVETSPNAGAVYMFDYIANYNESLTNIGKFVYAQSVNSKDIEYGYSPKYGESIDFNQNVVMVGAPNFNPEAIDGQVTVYENETGIKDWTVFRSSAPIVDIDSIQNAQIFSVESNNTLINLDYIDPLQGKLLGSVRQNIDVVSSVDPANYNNVGNTQSGMIWGASKIGNVWFDTKNVRFVNYHQNDVVYNSQYWGTVFPGSDVAVYSWIASNVPPSEYEGPGTPKDITNYTVSSRLDSSNAVVPVYYFWVRNTNIVFRQEGKTLSDTIIESYIKNPIKSGIAFVAPLKQNTFAIYNSGEYINANDSVFHIGYANGTTDDEAHVEYTLIREDFADDFLPGIPKLGSTAMPEGLYDRLLDSLSGVDEAGSVVPNPFLPKAVQSGIFSRPRQSFFYDRYLALKNYLTYANEVLTQFPISEIRPDISFLFAKGEFYDTTNYWQYINWWSPGYNNSTKPAIQVPIYADLSALTVPTNTIVEVENNGSGRFEFYRYDGNDVWTRIGLQNGTIEFNLVLWDYAEARLGFGDNFYDTDTYDEYPSEETRNIVRALNEQIYIEELLIFRNKGLILLFEYIQSESIESQNYLPWLNKTSLVDVAHTIRELTPIEVFQTDNQDFLEGYLNEVKPYHVVIKEFVFKYTGSETYNNQVTDFDLPAEYNSSVQQFITPELVYTIPNSASEYQNTNDIWQTAPYTQWYQNKGVSLSGQPDYQITTLTTYMTIGSNVMFVDNAQGFPINGVIKIGDEEIAYSSVDRALNMITGLSRGLNGTTATVHYPNDKIYIDLPEVLVLDGGRGYTEPPRITAYIDLDQYPAPTKEAILEPVMSLDSVISVNVIDPGQGYMVLPEIRIEPSTVIAITNSNINSQLHTIVTNTSALQTGDLVFYRAGENQAGVGKLLNNQWYYVNVLETVPTTSFALYTNYSDAINDTNRVLITDIGFDDAITLSLGARASAISSATPIRENNITVRFDRTSYTSQVQDWRAGVYYGSFFAGSYFNSATVASSSIELAYEQVLPVPLIASIQASAQGAVFEIADVTNNRQLTWSSFERTVGSTQAGNVIRLIPEASTDHASGSTIGFYVGMPIKFTGIVIGGLQEDTTYYVKTIIDDTDFTVSLTEDGSTEVLTPSSAVGAGLKCYTGQVTDTAVLTVNYPGILEATSTQSGTNAITVPLNLIGTGGTQGFYTNLPVFFVGDVFGGIEENETYYVTTVIDKQRFTISQTPDPVITIALSTSGASIITVDSTEGFNTNDAIIFTNITVAGSSSTTLGNIVAGTTYYVREVISDTELTISAAINGVLFNTGTVAAAANTAAQITSQAKTVKLTTDTGSMTLNVSLPISPGQVNGQKFTLYNTSGQYANITGTNGNIIERIAAATIADVDRIPISIATIGLDDFYVNMPVVFDTTVGGITAATTYYVIEYSGMPNLELTVTDTTDTTNEITCNDTSSLYVGMPVSFSDALGGIDADTVYYVESIVDGTNFTITTTPGGSPLVLSTDTGSIVCTCEPNSSDMPNIQVLVTSTSSSGNAITCNSTESLYVDMPIVFSGAGIGGIVISVEYYIESIIDGTNFTISDTPGGSVKTLITQTGSMVGVGTPYIKVSLTKGGAPIGLTDTVGDFDLTQEILSNAVFDISYILGGYRAIVSTAGEGYAVNNTISIPGNLIGGITPENDLLLTVNSIDSDGEITDVVCSGVVSDQEQQYYLKVVSPNELEVYSDPLMTVPVSGVGFIYDGFTTTTATEIVAATNQITVSSSDDFNVNDPVVFTGNIFSTEIELGKTYYIYDKPLTTTVRLTTNPGGTVINFTINASGSMTMAKAGSYAFLPEPFYFNQSIVKYQGRVYVCVVSNNDNEFVIGKWQLIEPSDRRLNAMDRAIAYYQPTVNMPGVDLTQLFTGVTYPNTTYLGNPFAPADQYELDVLLESQPFDNNTFDYDIQGGEFLSGYAPEELVAGVVSDNLTMIVNTRPGTNWDADEYAHTGFKVISLELEPEFPAQVEYSFNNATQYPFEIFVAVIDGTTGVSTTIYENIDYTIDWINNVVVLDTALTYAPVKDILRIDVYETGNGDQLVRSNSKTDPIRINTGTGFNEIFLNCNYSASLFAGSGAIRPTTGADIEATETVAASDTIVCDNVGDLILNGPIRFFGSVFGGIVANKQYYVKSIDYIGDTITISETTVNGVAGPIFALSNALGSMLIQVEGSVWSDPLVYHNGNKLLIGTTSTAISTKSSNNAIVVVAGANKLIENSPIKFCQCMFGNDILPMTTYYVKTVINDTEFTISDTQGGSVKVLSDATGTSMFVSNDYAIGLADNNVSAKLIFAESYNSTDDYLTYTIFGETDPIQYGYSIPETQIILGDGANTVFTLTNFVGKDNVTDAIVEIDGLRVVPADYTIDSNLDTITFSGTPGLNSVIAVTTFNDTQRQYLNTQSITVTSTEVVSSIQSISTEITPPLATTRATSSTAGAPNEITVDSTTGFVVNSTVQFKGTSFDVNILTDGTVYFVDTIVSPTVFKIKDENGSVIVTAGGTGAMQVVVGGTPTTRVTTNTAHGFSENDVVRIDGTLGSVQLNNNTYYAKIIDSVTFDLYETGILGYTGYDPAVGAINYPVTGVSNYIGDGYTWIASSYTITSVWDQVNTDRLWVTVNGYRVPSSSLVINENNELSILTSIANGDEVVITSMMPYASPDEEIYLNFVNKNGIASVYRANTGTRTWLTQPIQDLSTEIYVDDVSRLARTIVQTETTPAVDSGFYYIGLSADKRLITSVTVFNQTTNQLLSSDDYQVVVENLSPTLKITAGAYITTGDQLTITILEGNTVYINGEQIRFGAVDFDNNTLSNLERGVNGTSKQPLISTYTEVYGLLSANRLNDVYYNQTWNSNVFNVADGDPLQISQTAAAEFLNTDIIE